MLHRAAYLAARSATSPSAEESGASQLSPLGDKTKQVLLTTFNGNLAESLNTQLDLLIHYAAVRSQIEVLNVDRLAYSIVKQARGNPVIADERELRARWAEAAADAGLALRRAGRGRGGRGSRSGGHRHTSAISSSDAPAASARPAGVFGQQPGGGGCLVSVLS